MIKGALVLVTVLSFYIGSLGAFQKGMAFGDSPKAPFGSPESFQSLDNIVSVGGNSLCIVFSWYQTNINSTLIYPTDNTPTDPALASIIAKAKEKNMTVFLKPHVESLDGMWRAWIGTYFDNDTWKKWFSSYTTFLVYYAQLAEHWGVDYFSCGVEMISASRNADRFRDVISEIRKFYSGKVTYSANWGNKYQAPVPPHLGWQDEMGEIDTITWFDALDVVGVDAYYYLTENTEPAMQDLIQGWSPVLTKLTNISLFWKKNIIFTEIGYRSIVGAAVHPGWWNITAPVNVTQQALCYEAVFSVFTSSTWWEGIYWWIWSTDPNYGGSNNTDFTPQNKAETLVVLKNNYINKLGI